MEHSSAIYPKISKYLNEAYIMQGLNERFRNIEDVNFRMNSDKLSTITTMDEYFYRLMSEKNQYYPDNYLRTYLITIQRQLNQQPLLLLDLPIYKLSIKTLRIYFPQIDNIINRINQEGTAVCNIFKRFVSNPNSITADEFNRLLLYFSYSIPNADNKMQKAQEYLAKYILNNPINSAFNYYMTLFLIKFFGYKKIREENLSNTKILLGELEYSTFGSSKGNFVTINKTRLQRIKMRDNTLADKFGRAQDGQEILGIMQTLYHELRHQKQSTEAKNGQKNDIAFFMAARNIIYEMDQNFDYEANYNCYETEKDANIKGWEEAEKLIKTYMPSHHIRSVMKKILEYKLTEELEQITGVRKDKKARKYISIDLLINYLDQSIARNPRKVMSEYNQLNIFYNSDGTPKRLIELLKQPLVYNYKDFYFGQASYRSRNTNHRLIPTDISSLSPTDIKTIINNIKILMNTTQLKLNKINDRVKKSNETELQVISNIDTYHNFARYLSSITNYIIATYPQSLNNLTIRNAIDNINENITMINHNSIVNRNYYQKISRVGRR